MCVIYASLIAQCLAAALLLFLDSASSYASTLRSDSYSFVESSTETDVVQLPSKKRSGSASLKHTVIRKLAQHVDGLRASVLRHIPWPLVKPLWKYLVSNRLVSVEVWKTFATVYFAEDVDGSLGLRLKKFNASPFVHYGQWKQALSLIVSPPPIRVKNLITAEAEADSHKVVTTAVSRPLSMRIEFLTILEIANTRVSRLDLLFIPDIYNLYSLSIGPFVEVIQDRHSVVEFVDSDVFRSWSEAAVQDEKCFKVLHSFSLNQRDPPSSNAVRSLSRLPALTYMHIECVFKDREDKKFLARAGFNGWVKAKDVNYFDDRDIPITGKSVRESSEASFMRCKARSADQQSKHPIAQENRSIRKPCQADTLPIFHCQIIGPPLSELSNKSSSSISICLERESHQPPANESTGVLHRQLVAFQNEKSELTAFDNNPSIQQEDVAVREVKKPRLRKVLDTQDELLKLAGAN